MGVGFLTKSPVVLLLPVLVVFSQRKWKDLPTGFGANNVPVSVYKCNGSLRRETQFESSETWKDLLLNLNESETAAAFTQKLQKPVILVCRLSKFDQLKPYLPAVYKTDTVGVWLVITTGNTDEDNN
jgi:hypothetical protein